MTRKTNLSTYTPTNLDILAGITPPHLPTEGAINILIVTDNTAHQKFFLDLAKNLSAHTSISQSKDAPADTASFDLIIIEDNLSHILAQSVQPEQQTHILITDQKQSNILCLIPPLNTKECHATIQMIQQEITQKKDLLQHLKQETSDTDLCTSLSLTINNPFIFEKTAAVLAQHFADPAQLIYPIYKILSQAYIQENLGLTLSHQNNFSAHGISQNELIHISSLRNEKSAKMHIKLDKGVQTHLLQITTKIKDQHWFESIESEPSYMNVQYHTETNTLTLELKN